MPDRLESGTPNLPGIYGLHATSPVNACKFMLYQDPMVQLFAKDTEGFAMADHFAALAEEYTAIAKAGGEFAGLMGFYARLARVLAGKCRWHENIAAAVAREDRKAAGELAASLQTVEEETELLRQAWRALWKETNKPHGFEVIDGRLGAVRARLESARTRVSAWAAAVMASFRLVLPSRSKNIPTEFTSSFLLRVAMTLP